MTRPAARSLSLAGFLLTLGALPAGAQDGLTSMVSVSSDGVLGNTFSSYSDVSANGRVATFMGEADNFVPGDVNGVDDIFAYDRQTGVIELVSLSTQGVQADARCRYPSLSADGRYVAYASLASTLAAGTTGTDLVHVYRTDRVTDTTIRVSVNTAGQIADHYSTRPRISLDGRYITYISQAFNLSPADTNAFVDVYVHDVDTGTTFLASRDSSGVVGNGTSIDPDISADGRWIVFRSVSTNLDPSDGNTIADIYRHDQQTGQTIRISVSSAGVGTNGDCAIPSISADGNLIAFTSSGSNLVPNDTNGLDDVFVRDLAAGTTTRVSVGTGGIQGDGSAGLCNISEDGRWVTFSSRSTNLVPGDTNGVRDVFLHDLLTGTTTLVSKDSLGAIGNGDCSRPRISGDGQVVVFSSVGDDLVPGDTNGFEDVFVHDASSCPAPAEFCIAKVNSEGCAPVIASTGSASLGGADDFFLSATGVLNDQFGILIWSRTPQSVPFAGGTLCLASPTRTPAQQSGGNPPPASDCSGSYSFHFDQALMGTYALQVGEAVYAQYWSRDTGFAAPNNVGLTGGLQFQICP